ncbi:SDR family NAD(P)-dependent oxidoreductase [Ferrovibrio sp.]|uniref:SDR family NAD(P)-dependent oxidoreductase n=1 Tax=Ferrovibrio sp. TaxID=1917215 RepID=UPI0039C8583C
MVIAGRTAKRGGEVTAAIEADGGEACYVQADIGIESDVKKIIDTAIDRYGKLTTLINNAASTDLINESDGSIAATTASVWEQSMRVTLWLHADEQVRHSQDDRGRRGRHRAYLLRPPAGRWPGWLPTRRPRRQ